MPIPDTVNSIGDQAFEGCKNLKEINIPDSVETLGESAFSGCETLSKVKLSDNITSIQKHTFDGCTSLKEISLPYYTSTIGLKAFDKVPLEVITIGYKLKAIDNLPIHLSTLKAINVSTDNYYYSSDNGILYDKNKSTLIRFPAALKQTEYMAPKTVVTISESAFKDNTNIRNIYLYEKCSSVEPTAFQNCSHLDKIYFYNKNCDIYMSKDTIYEDAVINGYKGSTAEEYANMYGRAFNTITVTTATTIRTTTTTITTTTTTTTTTTPHKSTYQGLKYETSNGEVHIIGYTGELPSVVKIPAKIEGIPVTSIGECAFFKCTILKEITIPDSVTSIEYAAFDYCTRLTEITIPDSVTSIGQFAFCVTPWLDAKRKENSLVVVNGILIDAQTCSGVVTIPDSVTSIGDDAFNRCTSLTEITIPDSVTSIGRSAFDKCTGLTEITIPDSVTSIGRYAFRECTSLTEITIPDSVTSIGYDAFLGCTRLTIKGYSGSYAKTYANNNKISFELIEKAPTTTVVLTMTGDANVDGIVDLSDAVLIMQALANPNKYGLSGSDKSHITAQGAANADVEGNNGITANDALTIQKYLLKLISSLPV